MALIAVVGSLIGCAQGSSSAGAADAATELTIEVWPRGPSGTSREWTLRCDPPSGTLPNAARACGRLTPGVLRPLPSGMICTQVYGGPQVARVSGRFRRKRVDARFGRANGCEIHRWDQLRFLFPVKI